MNFEKKRLENSIEGDPKGTIIISCSTPNGNGFETAIHTPIRPGSSWTTGLVVETYKTWDECVIGHQKHYDDYNLKVLAKKLADTLKKGIETMMMMAPTPVRVFGPPGGLIDSTM
jgi:hypothetical protein